MPFQSGVFFRAAAIGLALFASACATTAPVPPIERPDPSGPPPVVGPEPTPGPAPSAGLQPVDTLPGFSTEDHRAVLNAWRATCRAARAEAVRRLCEEARALGDVSQSEARAFLVERFRAERIEGEGLLTGYFAPEYPARRAPDAEFSAPVRPRPSDLTLVDGALLSPDQAGRRVAARIVDGRPVPYPSRAEIEAAAESAPPLAWMRPEDLFFMQIQGSGYLTFEDGRRLRAAYAADNGRPFVGIARPMIERGILNRDEASGDRIRSWLAANRGPAADALMDENPRYVFFKPEADDGAHPAGAAGLALPAGRAVAVDPTRHAYGELFWIDGTAGNLDGAFPTYRRGVVALDTGGAIRGPVRADLYIGRGDVAGREAGRIRHRLTMWRLVPAA